MHELTAALLLTCTAAGQARRYVTYNTAAAARAPQEVLLPAHSSAHPALTAAAAHKVRQRGR
jgi:hypothetical protein